jgi:tetratricopeptide (TPR) repeat protein
MKRISLLILGLFLFCPGLLGQDNDSLRIIIKEAYLQKNAEKIMELNHKVNISDTTGGDMMYYLAWASGKNYRFAQSINYLEKAFQKDSNNYRVIQLLGKAYIKTGQSGKAYSLYNSVYQPDNSPLWLSNRLAELSYKLKRFSQAADIYKTLLQADSLNYYYYKKLGNTLFKMKQNKEAVETYQKALNLNPGDLSLYNKLGNLHLRMKQYSKARDIVHRGLQLDSANMQFLSLMGYTYFKTEHYDSSYQYFIKAIEQGDSSEFNHKYAGLACYDRELYAKASNHLNKAYQIDSMDVQTVFYLGSAFSRIEHKEKGLNYLFEALHLINPEPGSLVDIYKEMANTYKALSKPKTALHYYKEAYKVEAKPQLAFQMAYVYDKDLDKKELALNYYESYLTMMPEKDTSSKPTMKGKVFMISMSDYAKKRVKDIREELFFESGIGKKAD